MRESTARELLAKVKNDYTEIAGEFDATRQGNWKDFEVFDEYLADGMKILDIGCGNGRLKEYIDGKVRAKYFGTDNNDTFIEMAKKRGDFFKVGDFLSLPYPDNEFDLVLSVAAFHHSPTRKLQLHGLAEVSRIMKPGANGVFLVWNLWQRRHVKLFFESCLRFFASFGKYCLHDFFVPWGKKTERYYYAFTKRSLRKLFAKSNLKVCELDLSPSKNNYYVVFTK